MHEKAFIRIVVIDLRVVVVSHVVIDTRRVCNKPHTVESCIFYLVSLVYGIASATNSKEKAKKFFEVNDS